MRIRLLGTAAGGGLPQWNCACANCRAARRGEISARTQSSVVFSADGDHWFLVNASPDLRAQIEGFAPLQPTLAARRTTPIHGVFLTNADLDHVLGLFLLREGKKMPAYAPAGVRAALTQELPMDALLGAFGGLEWREVARDWTPLRLASGEATALSFRALELSSAAPPYVTRPGLGIQSVAYQIADGETGGRALIAPDVHEITPPLAEAMAESALVLFDGTFWSDDELSTLKPGSRTAREMGHLPIQRGSLPTLRNSRNEGVPPSSKHNGGTPSLLGMSRARRVFIHINNTNPILAPGSREHAETLAAGVEIGEDGQEFTV